MNDIFGVSVQGLGATGKTTIIKRLETGIFNENIVPSIYETHSVNMCSKDFIFFDRGGTNEFFWRNWRTDMRKSDLCLFVLDLSKRNEFNEARAVFNSFTVPNLDKKPLIIIGNKVDLIEPLNSDVELISEIRETFNNIRADFEVLITSASTGREIDRLESIICNLV
jgi:GTPase SAR1 family protein